MNEGMIILANKITFQASQQDTKVGALIYHNIKLFSFNEYLSLKILSVAF